MKISNVFIKDFLGVRDVDLRTDETVQIIAGANGSGKSSLRDAIVLALTADLGRVSLKKDAPQLINKGKDSAVIEVAVVDAEPYGVTISKAGKITDSFKGQVDPTLPFVLDGQRFAMLDLTARRAFLFGLMGLKTDGPAIVDRLLKKGLQATKVERIAPLLRTGFDAACKEAKAKATEAKGSWRAITGETYGAQKAKGWQAPAPAVDDEALKALMTEKKHNQVALASWTEELGKCRAIAEQHARLKEQLQSYTTTAGLFGRMQAKLQSDTESLESVQKALAEAEAKAGHGPRAGLVHELAWSVEYLIRFGDALDTKDPDDARVKKALDAYEAEHGKVGASGDPEALARLPELRASRDLMQRAVANAQRDLDACAKAQLEADRINEELKEVFYEGSLEAAQQAIAKLTDQAADIGKRVDAMSALKMQQEAAERKTKEAAAYHDDVAAWDRIGDALSPDGLQAEILAEALGPFNERLMRSAVDAGWMQVTVHEDMTISVNGQFYNLLSESEQWRCDAMLAEAIANISGIQLLLLDRFDVLDLQGRSELIAWLDVLVDNEEIDSVFIFGTLKSLPATLPSNMAAHWIDHGVVAQLKEAA